ncbi:MAG: hypothetical protein LAT77_09985 [Aliidiomarina sp.]|nr:hypothetical protein [Aliidiomarina sp.]MCH8502222.1 hypothetical protein [Aliidiomarina sp.]
MDGFTASMKTGRLGTGSGATAFSVQRFRGAGAPEVVQQYFKTRKVNYE